MSFVQFVKKYPTEEFCKSLIKKYRDKVGVICKRCGCKSHYWQTSIDMYQCKVCKFRTTLRSGTVIESSKLSYQYWLYAIYMVTIKKEKLSALEMKRQIGHKRYEPIWTMIRKIRAVMGNNDGKYLLEGIFDVDSPIKSPIITDSWEPINDAEGLIARTIQEVSDERQIKNNE